MYTTTRFATCVGRATLHNDIFCMGNHVAVWLADSWLMAVAAAANVCGEGDGLVGANKAAYVLPRVLPVVTLVAVCWVIVVTDALSLVTDAPSSNTL